ncbi:hypothetical protein BCV72DRAFT_206966, partial [Rhizopus microsporus var. microsporus]
STDIINSIFFGSENNTTSRIEIEAIRYDIYNCSSIVNLFDLNKKKSMFNDNHCKRFYVPFVSSLNYSVLIVIIGRVKAVEYLGILCILK